MQNVIAFLTGQLKSWHYRTVPGTRLSCRFKRFGTRDTYANTFLMNEQKELASH